MDRFLLIIILFATLSCSTDKRDYSLRKDLSDNGASKFYKDFDIFSRQGHEEIIGDTLRRPFFRVRLNNDSSINLTIYKIEFEREVTIPKDESMQYDFDDITDGPRHNYYKIFKDSIVVFGYEGKIDEVQNWPDDSVYIFELIPTEIHILTQDTLYVFFGRCFDIKTANECESEIKIPKSDFHKYIVNPFARTIKIDCSDCLIHYFDSTGHARHYYRYYHANEYLGKKNPGDGLFGYKKEFKFWRDYYMMVY